MRSADKKIPKRFIFIGMSGSGKTFWSKRLARFNGYQRIELDELIGNDPVLDELIKDMRGCDQAEKMGNYFGMPWEKGYHAKEEKYMEIERKFMSKEYPEETILDLTGSAIYHPQEMKKMAEQGLVIYIKTEKEFIDKMLQQYLNDPKPVIWGNIYCQRGKENRKSTLKRCYTELIDWRSREYEKYADVTIESKELRALEKGMALNFLDLILNKQGLRQTSEF